MRKRFNAATDRIWFTADLHFGHRAMLEVSNRPYTNVDHMDDTMLEVLNRHIGPRDHVFILGDVSFRNQADTCSLIAKIPGFRYLIAGNHDQNLPRYCLDLFDGGVADYHEIKVDDQLITLCHYPLRSWNQMHYGSWNLHGHSHGNLPPQGKQLDVGWDSMGLISYESVHLRMVGKTIVAVDHHIPKEQL